MRALVAESSVVTRVALRRILERQGYVVDELRDELAAACLLHQDEAPELAFLSLETVFVDFDRVCSAMREAKPDVYIVALVPEARRIDLPSILEAGADDFIIKPISLQETEARVRVIRHATTGTPVDARSGTSGNAKDRNPVDALLKETNPLPLMRAVFDQMGLAPIEEVDHAPPIGGWAYSSWSPVVALQSGAGKWLNVRLDVDETNARRLFDLVHRRAVFAVDRLVRTLSDVMELLEDVVRDLAEGLDETEIHFPREPMSGRAGDIPKPRQLSEARADEKRLTLRLRNELELSITLTAETMRREAPAISRVHSMDVLAQDIESGDHRIMLLRAGTMLTPDYIRKIEAFFHSRNLSEYVEIYRPPRRAVVLLTQLRPVEV